MAWVCGVAETEATQRRERRPETVRIRRMGNLQEK